MGSGTVEMGIRNRYFGGVISSVPTFFFSIWHWCLVAFFGSLPLVRLLIDPVFFERSCYDVILKFELLVV